MMPIVFWASFEPWLKAMNAGRHDLEAPEPVVQLPRVHALEDVQQHDHEPEPDQHAQDRRGDEREDDLAQDPVDLEGAGPAGRDDGPDQARR